MTCTLKTKQNNARANPPYKLSKITNACTFCHDRRIRCLRTNDGAGHCKECIKRNFAVCLLYLQKPAGRPPKSKIPTCIDTGHEEAQKPTDKSRRPRKTSKRGSGKVVSVEHTSASTAGTLAAPSPLPASIISVEDMTDEGIPTHKAFNWTLPPPNQEALFGADLQAPAHPGYPLDGHYSSQQMVSTQLTGAFYPESLLVNPIVFGPYAAQSLAGPSSAFGPYAAQPLAGPPNYGLIPNFDYYGGVNPWPQYQTQPTAGSSYYTNMPSARTGIQLQLDPMDTSMDDVTNYWF